MVGATLPRRKEVDKTDSNDYITERNDFYEGVKNFDKTKKEEIAAK